MHWDYRIVRTEERLAIHEVYYADDGVITGCTVEPVAACGEDVNDVFADLMMMHEATRLPVLDIETLPTITQRPRV